MFISAFQKKRTFKWNIEKIFYDNLDKRKNALVDFEYMVQAKGMTRKGLKSQEEACAAFAEFLNKQSFIGKHFKKHLVTIVILENGKVLSKYDLTF